MSHNQRMTKPYTTEMDCPDCLGAGKATQRRDRDTNIPIDLTCGDCDFHVTYDDADDSDHTSDDSDDSDDSADEPTSFPHHTGAGWYLLSNGEKVRGKDEAHEAQDAIDGA